MIVYNVWPIEWKIDWQTTQKYDSIEIYSAI